MTNMSSKEHQAGLRAKASNIIKELMKTVDIEIVKPYRQFLVRVTGGIVDGCQIMEFDSKQEAVDYVVQHLYPFYTTTVGKLVNLKINA